ncbi:kti12, chromatin associated [Exophiala xenobiotica]|nr:kti12, chromatin associated [Exophiala xenobiotica]
MPLLIITGLPCSGKTHRAQQIAADLKAYISSDPASFGRRTVQIIPSHHASADESYDEDKASTADTESLRDQIYNSAAQEKNARAAEFSAIKRAVSKDNIVIADGLNYIKGYRYQLWCEAKAVGTRCCVVHVASQEDQCKQWNRERLRAWGRAEDTDTFSGTSAGTGTEQKNGSARQRQGESVMGDLMPESHTAIYGDRRVVDNKPSSRSRSSSMDNGFDGDGDGDEEEGGQRPLRAQGEDTMTLKSLYISDRRPDADTGTDSAAFQAPSSSTSTSNTPHPHHQELPSRTTPTPSALLEPPPPTCSPPYSVSTLTSLAMRYEPPSPFSRWDTPLFTIPSTDTVPPTRDIWAALFPAPVKPTSKKALSQLRPSERSHNTATTAPPPPEEGAAGMAAKTNRRGGGGGGGGKEEEREGGEEVRPHAATVLPRATDSDALQTLESATMDVVRLLLARAREFGVADADSAGEVDLSVPLVPTPMPGSGVSVSGSKSESESGGFRESESSTMGTSMGMSIYIPASVALSQPMLQRLRRKYTQIQRAGIAHGHGYVKGRAAVVKGFVEFLEHEWNDDD